MRSTPALPWHQRPAYRFVRRGVLSLGVAAIAVLLLRGPRHPGLMPTMAYTLSITLGCWFFIDAGRIALSMWVWRGDRDDARHGQWPGWLWMTGLLLVGTSLGYGFGVAMGNWITGYDRGAGSWEQALGLIGIALIPAVTATYFFYSREHIAHAEAQVQAAQRQAAENQLKLLESQLEPHMLFNTLANLRVLIGIDPARAQAMLDRLIAFLRATLQASRTGSHTLADEFGRIADYLELMQIRMGPRLQTALDLPPELAGCPVPPLLLQPLVENAIKHGLEPHVGGGRLEVKARQEGGTLVITVRDTGKGLGGTVTAGTGFGLGHVRERLATLHGERASLQIRGADDGQGGAEAVVRLPAASPSPA
jgi:hypothetical protein